MSERGRKDLRENGDWLLTQIERSVYGPEGKVLDDESREILREWWTIKKNLSLDNSGNANLLREFSNKHGEILDKDALLIRGIKFITKTYSINLGKN